TELLAQPIYQSLLKEYCSQANQSIDLLKAGRELLPQEYTAQLSHLDNEIMLLNYLVLEPKDLSQYLSRLHGVKFNSLTWRGRSKIQRVCDLRDAAKGIINKQREKLDGALKTEAEKLAMQKPHLEALFSFVRQVDDIYSALKKERGVIDFSDMEHLALRALADVGVASTLKNKFDYIFVDEYQDSSRIQESIINAIRKDSNMFLVGDVKQSIYRFRQADPGLFIEKLEEFEAQAKNSRAIHLNMNFRSSEPVIDAINAVFSRIMSKEAAELAYDENAALKCAEFNKEADALAGVEFHLIEFSEFEAVSAKMEARLAAKRIHELMKTGVLCNRLSGISRPLRYSDFAILLRSAKPVALDWAQTLADMGIPAYVQLTGGYFDSMEVKVFLSLLRLLDNRRQDIPLLSALLS
ncbi:MAG TPA: UvrD-helicase domain-containing protein, partial [Clostridia bacterium]|nr:UvrD-helicase domain-containing protein [Clostridia bacterium]